MAGKDRRRVVTEKERNGRWRFKVMRGDVAECPLSVVSYETRAVAVEQGLTWCEAPELNLDIPAHERVDVCQRCFEADSDPRSSMCGPCYEEHVREYRDR